MNEAETRAEHIDPALAAAGWGVVEGSRIRREYPITLGRLEGHGRRGKPMTADYVLEYRNTKLAVVEAKAWDERLTEGVAQAKNYAAKLAIRFTYASNGQGIYGIDMQTGTEGDLPRYPTPEELWSRTFAIPNAWRDRFAAIPFEDRGGYFQGRYYQDIAIERVLEAIAAQQQRILLTLATGTGKTFIAFQIAWKLFQSRWNLSRQPDRRPRILFLADRNILADQAYNAFSAFPEDAMVRIAPDDIRKKGRVPKNGSLFFTIFQTFMSGGSTGSPTDLLAEITTIRNANGYMYILECADGSFYTGSTIDLPRRVTQHKNGEGAEYTKRHLPVKLVFYETYDRISEAFAREKQVQGWTQAKKLALIKGDIELLRKLSSSRKSAEMVAEPVTAVPEPVEGYFGEYPPDFFDFVIIDECHRGGANDESTWRDILIYFAPAVQLGLTATPKRRDNIDTYAYFGDPVYIYSLKDGINDGYLTPFKVKQISTTLDEYVYTPDDKLIEGEIETGRRYVESDFNKIIEIKERETRRVKIFMDQINQNEKTLVFCATQDHALAVRDLINQMKTSTDPNYCQRVTANDGELGEQHLRDFQDNEKSIPTVLTTSQKLSTGVDARNIRNIVLMRPVNQIIEFKQIIGRGTRLYDGKDYFTIYDFVNAHRCFLDPEWDSEPIEPEPGIEREPQPPTPPGPPEPPPEPNPRRQKIKVKLADGKARAIQHMMVTSFWHPDGTPMSAQQFMELLFGKLPEFFKNEAELRALWSVPNTRAKLLQGLAEKGFGGDQLAEMQRIIDAEKSDIFDVLAYIAYALPTLSRQERAANAHGAITLHFNTKEQAFLDFVLTQYVKQGVHELDTEKLSPLLKLKYNNAIADAIADLGRPEDINRIFTGFQQYLYAYPPT